MLEISEPDFHPRIALTPREGVGEWELWYHTEEKDSEHVIGLYFRQMHHVVLHTDNLTNEKVPDESYALAHACPVRRVRVSCGCRVWLAVVGRVLRVCVRRFAVHVVGLVVVCRWCFMLCYVSFFSND